MAKRHVNIPIFIPHLGCPNTCVFCNQRTISGVSHFDISCVRRQIDDALLTVDSDSECEIAFFGGSFTGIDRQLMISLLEIAKEYTDRSLVDSVRCSTRPDYIDEEILDILEEYGVNTVELGLQSVSEEVLRVTKRGHGFSEEKRAAEMIIARGINLVGQMMIGLPGSTLEDELETARFIINSGATGARIYPTVVFNETELCSMAERGEYTPLTLDDAVMRSAKVLKLFLDADVKVVRIGLCSSDNLSSEDTYFAGPNHPALGELVFGELYYLNIKEKLSVFENIEGARVTVFVARGSISKAIGQKKKNRLRLLSETRASALCFAESEALTGYEVEIKVEERTYKCI